MIADLKPYPAMKDSGVEWLGEVPAHWKVTPNRSLFDEIKERDYPDEQMLSVTIKQGVIRQSALLEDTSKKDSSNLDRSNYKLVRPGDIAYNKMRAWQGAIGVSNYRGIISPAYIVQRPRVGSDSRYFHYLFRTPAFAKEAERWSYGITSDMWSLRPQHFKLIYTCLPPPPEQAAIYRFLDYVGQRVRRYVRAKQKLIELLEEQKQTIIHHAVIGQIDVRTCKPYPAYKPSGVDWLGEIPEHWEFNRGKFYFQEVDVRSTTGKEELLSVSHITGVTPRSQKNIYMFKAESYIGYKLCNPGQIAINTMWAWMAAIGVSRHHGIISSSYHTYEQITSLSFYNDFLDILLRSMPYKNFYTVNSTGITSSRLRLYPEDFLNIRFLCPPRDEQESIVDSLKDAIIDINTAIESTRRKIKLLREYHISLNADVVTGKLDVREAASTLPDEPGLPETLDEADDLMDGVNSMPEDVDTIPEDAEA